MGNAQRTLSPSYAEAKTETPTPAQLRRTDDRFETEASLLGALLHYGDPISYRLAASIVASEQFDDAFNARLFSIIGTGVDAQLKAFPLVHFVMTELRDDPTLKDMNTSASALIAEYIARCAPRIGIEGCARQIRHDYLNDKLKIAVDEGETAETETLAAEMKRLKTAHLIKDETSQPISKSVPAILDRLAELYQNGVVPNTDAYPGSHELQQLFGGWRRGKFYVLGGRPGMGKSTAALSWMLRTAEHGHGVAFFSLEMTVPELTEIAMCDLAWDPKHRIEYRDIASTSARAEGLDWKYEALRTASERLNAMPFTIVDKSGLTLADIRAQAIQQSQRLDAQGKRLEVVIIDHLGLIKPSSTYSGNKVAETEELSAALKAMAKELGVAVVCLVQLNRGVEGREDKQPSLADLRWSGAIEQDADLVLFVYRESYYLQKEKDDPMEDMARRTKLDSVRNELKLIVAKHRGGPTPTLKFFCDMGCGVVRDSAR